MKVVESLLARKLKQSLSKQNRRKANFEMKSFCLTGERHDRQTELFLRRSSLRERGGLWKTKCHNINRFCSLKLWKCTANKQHVGERGKRQKRRPRTSEKLSPRQRRRNDAREQKWPVVCSSDGLQARRKQLFEESAGGALWTGAACVNCTGSFALFRFAMQVSRLYSRSLIRKLVYSEATLWSCWWKMINTRPVNFLPLKNTILFVNAFLFS